MNSRLLFLRRGRLMINRRRLSRTVLIVNSSSRRQWRHTRTPSRGEEKTHTHTKPWTWKTNGAEDSRYVQRERERTSKQKGDRKHSLYIERRALMDTLRWLISVRVGCSFLFSSCFNASSIIHRNKISEKQCEKRRRRGGQTHRSRSFERRNTQIHIITETDVMKMNEDIVHY